MFARLKDWRRIATRYETPHALDFLQHLPEGIAWADGIGCIAKAEIGTETLRRRLRSALIHRPLNKIPLAALVHKDSECMLLLASDGTSKL